MRMSDDRRGGDAPAWGRVGPEDPTADPATHPAMRVPSGEVERSEQPTVAVPTGDGAGGAGGAGGAAGSAGDGPAGDDTPTVRRRIPNTRTGGLWAALILSAVVLIFLLVFILQNTEPVVINFLWLTGTLPTGVALLFAAIAGVLLVAVPGTGRILQLRREARRT
ncbi:putative membrane protein [Pseudonocardia sp. Ae168_Ps1]|nr:putative membrane protein [Pseudonocardia sp. Ae150A_Ps1]OLL82703.1 putative membrane protein [Pseudonocardia sp. Ae168_Ps1]OLL83184.1 putative membrane protein [Pseudonocardia sp. Ae263_Ps1]OLL90778.1 putative membrane protein [Pseudonocardia sp. Ae356_Ps1]